MTNFNFATLDFAYDLQKKAIDYVLNKKYNVIWERTLRDSKVLNEMNRAINEKNYTSTILVIAVGMLESFLSIHERYSRALKDGEKFLVLNDFEQHDESYKYIPDTLEKLIVTFKIQVEVYEHTTEGIHPKNCTSAVEAVKEVRNKDNLRLINDPCLCEERIQKAKQIMRSQGSLEEDLQTFDESIEHFYKLFFKCYSSKKAE